MSFLEELYESRRKLADVLADEEYQGIREIVEELYPDKAHFIYELLQNAEDAGATDATFTLYQDHLLFEHDGRPFTEQDVRGITNIGRGSKRNSPDKIGRFGVGFKAVFAYSETPRVWSPTFSFWIENLVLPRGVQEQSPAGRRTRFEFPFNNPKKAAPVAFNEVQAGLQALKATSLLFLNNLARIQWSAPGGAQGTVERVQHSEFHVEIISENAEAVTRAHYLKFDRPVPELPSQRTALAFELSLLPGVEEFDTRVPLAEQLRVARARPGQVFVFFPAEKETSGLYFHIHAPFVPELSRASVKDTPANDPLFSQLAELTAAALHHVRDLGMLTTGFLSVLPNDNDDLPERYHVIRELVIAEMQEEALTPTYLKGHAPANALLQARTSMKELLGEDDLSVFFDFSDGPRQWAAGVNQKNSRLDRFLTSLEIEEWDVTDFVTSLVNHASSETGWTGKHGRQGRTPSVIQWLEGKSPDWFQQLYGLLETDYLPKVTWHRTPAAELLSQLLIVRLRSEGLGTGAGSFFSPVHTDTGATLPIVDPLTYTSGKNASDHLTARTFLEAIGVRELGEIEQMEAYLARHYSADHLDVSFDDILRFVDFTERHPEEASLFHEAYIFLVQGDDPTTDVWARPEEVMLCDPLLDTGLDEVYADEIADGEKFVLSTRYLDLGAQLPRFLRFCEAVGVQTGLQIQTTSCFGNPRYRDLVQTAPGGWSESYGVNQDFTIHGIGELLEVPDIAVARLIWRTMGAQPDTAFLQASYRNNSNYHVRHAPSQLVACLTRAAWVPQGDGVFVRPAEAVPERLPEYLEFNADSAWVQAIGFGLEATRVEEQKLERQKFARELGFRDEETLERARLFSEMPEEEQLKALAACQSRTAAQTFPEKKSSNPERRTERVIQEAGTAPGRETTLRQRSVSVSQQEVRARARQYLIDQYTADEQMFCQICAAPMPFTLSDGSPYFEAVELISSLGALHYQNYIALCPNHSAMFQYANDSREELLDDLLNSAAPVLELMLARQPASMRFTEMHLDDLKAVLNS